MLLVLSNGINCGLFKKICNHVYPKIPETSDASRIDIFDSVINAISE